jgi:hypothetical protein
MKLICRKHYFDHCDITIRTKQDINNSTILQKLKPNQLIGIQRDLLETYINTISINIPHSIHIIDHDTKSCCYSVDKQLLTKLYAKNDIIKCISENWIDGDYPKLQPVPIGLESKTIDMLTNFHKENPPLSFCQKPMKISSTFHHTLLPGKRRSGFISERPYVLNILKNNSLVDFLPKLNKQDYFKHYDNYKFTISPTGNGIDCHRTWEAILRNTIPIVKTGPLDFLYKYYNFPVAIVNDWNDITPELLKHFELTLGPKLETVSLSLESFLI